VPGVDPALVRPLPNEPCRVSGLRCAEAVARCIVSMSCLTTTWDAEHVERNFAMRVLWQMTAVAALRLPSADRPSRPDWITDDLGLHRFDDNEAHRQ